MKKVTLKNTPLAQLSPGDVTSSRGFNMPLFAIATALKPAALELAKNIDIANSDVMPSHVLRAVDQMFEIRVPSLAITAMAQVSNWIEQAAQQQVTDGE